MKQRILRAAMDLFLKEGFEQVTIRRIAERIEYSPGNLYRYFVNKNEIFFALRAEGFELFHRRQLVALKLDDPLERLRRLGEIYIEFALENPEYYELMFIMKAPMEHVGERDDWMETVKSFQLGRDAIRESIEASRLRVSDVESTALITWSLLHGLVSLYLRDRFVMHPEMDLKSAAPKILDSVLSLLKAE